MESGGFYRGKSVKYLSKATIVEALLDLSSELEVSDQAHELIIAGGAAIVLLYGARDSTKDVDAVFSNNRMEDAARRVATRLSLPEDWLNDAAKGYLHGLARGEVVLQTSALVVRALAPEQLLAMKLSAWRDDLDVEDARLLLSKLVGSKEQIWTAVARYLVPGRELKARYAFLDLWENDRADSTSD
jgi:hypothetical protein